MQKKFGKVTTISRVGILNSNSKYALKNIDEFISECLAESMSKKSRATAKQVAKIIAGGD